MIHWTDLVGFAGFVMVALGLRFLFPSSADGMIWQYQAGGVLLWTGGFAAIVGWLLLRWWQAGKSHPK